MSCDFEDEYKCGYLHSVFLMSLSWFRTNGLRVLETGQEEPVYDYSKSILGMYGQYMYVLSLIHTVLLWIGVLWVTRPNIVRYFINNYRNWGRISIICWIYKRHTIPRPNGRAMGWLLWIFVRKLTAEYVLSLLWVGLLWVYHQLAMHVISASGLLPRHFSASEVTLKDMGKTILFMVVILQTYLISCSWYVHWPGD